MGRSKLIDGSLENEWMSLLASHEKHFANHENCASWRIRKLCHTWVAWGCKLKVNGLKKRTDLPVSWISQENIGISSFRTKSFDHETLVRKCIGQKMYIISFLKANLALWKEPWRKINAPIHFHHLVLWFLVTITTKQ